MMKASVSPGKSKPSALADVLIPLEQLPPTFVGTFRGDEGNLRSREFVGRILGAEDGEASVRFVLKQAAVRSMGSFEVNLSGVKIGQTRADGRDYWSIFALGIFLDASDYLGRLYEESEFADSAAKGAWGEYHPERAFRYASVAIGPSEGKDSPPGRILASTSDEVQIEIRKPPDILDRLVDTFSRDTNVTLQLQCPAAFWADDQGVIPSKYLAVGSVTEITGRVDIEFSSGTRSLKFTKSDIEKFYPRTWEVD